MPMQLRCGFFLALLNFPGKAKRASVASELSDWPDARFEVSRADAVCHIVVDICSLLHMRYELYLKCE
jgi:hypothetical protein